MIKGINSLGIAKSHKCTHDECEKLFLGIKEYERSEDE